MGSSWPRRDLRESIQGTAAQQKGGGTPVPNELRLTVAVNVHHLQPYMYQPILLLPTHLYCFSHHFPQFASCLLLDSHGNTQGRQTLSFKEL